MATVTMKDGTGYRCIAHDRRGHGRSTQPWDGNEMGIRAGVRADRSQFFKDLTLPFYGFNRAGRACPRASANPSGCRA